MCGRTIYCPRVRSRSLQALRSGARLDNGELPEMKRLFKASKLNVSITYSNNRL